MAEDPTFYLKPSTALPYVEMRSANQSSACYRTHSHDEFSFGVIDQGQACYLNGGRRNAIHQGHMVTINPGDAHSCNPAAGSWSYRMLFVRADWIGRLQRELGSFQGDYEAFPSQYQDSARYYASFDDLFRRLESETEPLQAESLLIDFLVSCLKPKTAEQRMHTEDQVALTRIRERIMDCLSDNLSLDSLSEISGLSRYHLIRTFKQRYGMAPHAYQLDQRIKHAKTRLRQGEALSQVAVELGFSDQAHFQRHFKQRIAMTPGYYQAQYLGQKA